MANSPYQIPALASRAHSVRRMACDNLHAHQGRRVGCSYCAGLGVYRKRPRSWTGGGAATVQLMLVALHCIRHMEREVSISAGGVPYSTTGQVVHDAAKKVDH
jgi:hypothetical protein